MWKRCENLIKLDSHDCSQNMHIYGKKETLGSQTSCCCFLTNKKDLSVEMPSNHFKISGMTGGGVSRTQTKSSPSYVTRYWNLISLCFLKVCACEGMVCKKQAWCGSEVVWQTAAFSGMVAGSPPPPTLVWLQPPPPCCSCDGLLGAAAAAVAGGCSEAASASEEDMVQTETEK